MTGIIYFKEKNRSNISEFIKLKQNNFIKTQNDNEEKISAPQNRRKSSKSQNKFISDYEDLIRFNGKNDRLGLNEKEVIQVFIFKSLNKITYIIKSTL